MKKSLSKYSYVMQVVIVIFIALVTFWVTIEAFELHSYWTAIIMAIVSAMVSMIMSSVIELCKKYQRERKLAKTWQEEEDINFGINNYAFYDHDDCGYLDGLISIQLLDQTYIYDFKKNFIENALNFPKIKRIQELFVEKKLVDDIEKINQLIENLIIEQKIEISDNSPVLLLDTLAKSRKDVGERLEASSLDIKVIKSDTNTKRLIDAIYTYFKKTYPHLIEASYKTNTKPENKENFIDDFLCLSTSIALYGCLIKQDGGSTGVEYYLHKTVNLDGIRLDITLENAFKEENEIHCDTFALLINEQIKQNYGISIKGKKHFTDVIFEFEKELKCNLLYSAQPDESIKKQPNFSLIYTNQLFTNCFMKEVKDATNYKQQFYLCYAQSIVRKYINKRFKQ